MPDGHDYEIEVGGKTYEMHSDKPLDQAAIAGVVAKFKKQSAAPSRPAVSTTDKTAASAVAGGMSGMTAPSSVQHQARQKIQSNIEANRAARRQSNTQDPLSALRYAVQPIEQQLGKMGRALTSLPYVPMQIPGAPVTPETGKVITPKVSSVQAEMDRQTKRLPGIDQLDAQDPRGALYTAFPDLAEYLDSDQGRKDPQEGLSKGVAGGVLGMMTVDNAVLGQAMSAVGGGKWLMRAASGAFGAMAAKQAWEGVDAWKKSGGKDMQALGNAAASATIAGMAFSHGAKGIKGEMAGRGKPAESPLAKAAAKDPLVADKPETVAKTVPKEPAPRVSPAKRAETRTKAVVAEPSAKENTSDNTAQKDAGNAVPKAGNTQRAKTTAAEGSKAEAVAATKRAVADLQSQSHISLEEIAGPDINKPVSSTDKDFLAFVDKHPKGKVYTKASDLYQAYKMEHPKVTREEFGQMMQHVAVSDTHEIVTPSANLPETGVFKFKDSTGIERRVAGVRPSNPKGVAIPDRVSVSKDIQEGPNFEASRKLVRPSGKPGVSIEPLITSVGEFDSIPHVVERDASGKPIGIMQMHTDPEVEGSKEVNYISITTKPGSKGVGERLVRHAIEQGYDITTKLDENMFTKSGAKFANRIIDKAKKDIALREKGPQELGTFNPLKAILGDDWYEESNKNITELYQGTVATVNPYSLDPTAQKMALIGKDYMARQAAEAVRRVHNLRFVRNAFDSIAAKTPGITARFMFDMQGGNKHADPIAQKYGDVFRKALDDKRTEVQSLGTGALDFYDEHYFPQEWKNPGKASRMFGESRAPLQGSKKFLHKKKIPTIEQGMFPQGTPANLDKMSMKEIKAEVKKQGGLEPWSYNPAEMVQHKLQEQDKFITAQKWADEAKTSGLMKSSVKFNAERDARVAAGQPAGSLIPEGWEPLKDNMFKIVEHRKTAGGGTEKIEHGQYYAPEGAARILNNYLSPGLANHPTIGPGYRAIRAGANMLVQTKLGLSGFHWTGESINAMFSGGARAVQEVSRGQFKSAGKSLAMAAAGVATPIKYYVDGKVLFAEAMKPGSQPVRYAAMLDYLMKGGGRLEMPHEFRVGAMDSFAKAFRQMHYRGMALNTPMAIAESTMAPLMREAVPKMKLGAFMDMMSAEIDRLGPGASIETQRASAARIWDSVENRFGELTYDNLFLDNMVKDVLHLTTMAPGWNIGSAREGLGAVKDVLTTRSRMKAGGPVVTERTAFAFSLTVGTAYLGYIYNKLHGRNPKTIEDLFFPVGPDGKRVQLPTYARDAHGMATDPKKTIVGKAHPGMTMAWEFMHGRDYFGRPIKDWKKWLSTSIVPISMKPEGDESELDAFRKGFTTPGGRERLMGITPVSGQGQKKKEKDIPY